MARPILSLLAYGAYDLNRRIENQQTVTIAARNAVMMGEAFSKSDLNETIMRQIEVEGSACPKAFAAAGLARGCAPRSENSIRIYSSAFFVFGSMPRSQ